MLNGLTFSQGTATMTGSVRGQLAQPPANVESEQHPVMLSRWVSLQGPEDVWHPYTEDSEE